MRLITPTSGKIWFEGIYVTESKGETLRHLRRKMQIKVDHLEPRIYVADEPVSMIDVSLKTTIIDLMFGFRKELGLTYLFVTHDLAVAKYISDRIAINYLGKIIEMGSKESIFLDPLHPYTKALLSAIPVPDPERKRQNIDLQGEVPSAIKVPPGCRFNPRCPIKQPECDKQEPELIEVENDHLVACPHY